MGFHLCLFVCIGSRWMQKEHVGSYRLQSRDLAHRWGWCRVHMVGPNLPSYRIVTKYGICTYSVLRTDSDYDLKQVHTQSLGGF